MNSTKATITRHEFYASGPMPIHSVFNSTIGHVHYTSSRRRAPGEQGEILIAQHLSDIQRSQISLTLHPTGKATIYQQLWQRKGPTILSEQYGPWLGTDVVLLDCQPYHPLPSTGWTINPTADTPQGCLRSEAAIERTYLDNPARLPLMAPDLSFKELCQVQIDRQIMPLGSYIQEHPVYSGHIESILYLPRKDVLREEQGRSHLNSITGLMHQLLIGTCQVTRLNDHGSLLIFRAVSKEIAAEVSADFHADGTATLFVHQYTARQSATSEPDWFGSSLKLTNVVPYRVPGSARVTFWELSSGMPYYRLPSLLGGAMPQTFGSAGWRDSMHREAGWVLA